MDLTELNKERIKIDEAFEKEDQEVVLFGWVNNTRQLGKINFLVLKDSTGIIQVTAVKGIVEEGLFEKMGEISRESCIYIKGKIKSSSQAPGGKEIVPSSLEVLNSSEELLIDVTEFSKTELPKRLDYRFLDLHRKKIRAIFKIQSEITSGFRDFFYNEKFQEFQLPSIISSSSEGGTDLFEVNYFKKKAYLAQSPQLYKQMLACSPIERVYTITPVWRAEKHNTVRHLNESRQMDIEMAFAGQREVMEYLEKAVKYIVKRILEKCSTEIELLGMKEDLKVPEAKYLSYDETVKLLGIEYGEDLSPENEKALNEKFPNTIVFVHSWPVKIKPFYIMPKNGDVDAELSEGFDAIYKGLEISSGGQRVHLPNLLIKMLKKNNLNPDHFKGYIDSFRFGAPPHGGWSIGLERLTQLVTGQKNIREAVLFPRDRDRLTP